MHKSLSIICLFFLLSMALFSQTTSSELQTKDSELQTKDSELQTKDSESQMGPKPSKTSTVTIESAQETEYKKDTVNNTEIIVLTGGVSLSVESGDTKTKITADLINYDRENKMLYAEGSVVLDQFSGDSVNEHMTSSSLLFNIDTLEGVFDDGRIVQIKSGAINLPSGSKLIVSSDLFAKNEASTIAFKNGVLTFCSEEDPHWKIKASRIWLLPGNEFAFFNAFLYVGHVPLVYLPFFYYPKDELIFNPVFGFKDREGYYIQTTTYIIGRKALESKDSSTQDTTETDDEIFNFLKPSSLKEQELRGLFLHNLDDEAKDVSKDYLKILLDYYTTLGGYVGVEGKFVPKAVVTDITFSAGLAFSRRIYTQSNNVPYHPETGEVIWDSSYLLGKEIPFRYAETIGLGFSLPSLTLSLSLPLYSDPYIESDFAQRSESMDWINFLLDNPVFSAPESVSAGTQKAALSSYKWNFKGSFTPNVSVLKPYITNLSISNFESSVLFSTKTQTDMEEYERLYSPNRLFFYPSSIKPAEFQVRLSGTLFSFPYVKMSSSTIIQKSENNESVLNLLVPPELEEPELPNTENPTNTDITINTDTTTNTESSDTLDDSLPETMLPSISVSPGSSNNSNNYSYSLTYDISPTLNSLVSSDVSKITKPEDFVFEQEMLLSTYYQVKSPVRLSSSLKLLSSLFVLNNSLSFVPHKQDHPYISQTAYPSEEDQNKIILNDYAAKSLDVENDNEFIIRPLLMTNLFSESTLSWKSSIKIVRTEFNDSYVNPSWDYKLPEWDKDSITSHTVGLKFSAKEGDFSQSLDVSSNLPPQLASYTGKLSLIFPYVTMSVESGYKKEEQTDALTNEKTEKFVFVPITQTLSVRLLEKKIILNQNYKFDIEEKRSTSFQTNLSLYGLLLAYNMQYTTPYELDMTKGWIAQDEKEFIPTVFSISYSLSGSKYPIWKNRISISPGLTTLLRFDLVRPTSTFFSFSPSLNFIITDFLTLSFSSESTNDVVFRYMQDIFDYGVNIPGEKNILKDLLRSFNFTNEVDRLTSGFKLKKLSIKVEHDLHDWILKSEFSFSPRLKTDKKPYYYDFSPYFSLSVVWTPMKSLKTQIVDDYGTFQLNP